MWWHKHTDPEKPLREQLLDAQTALTRQLENLRNPVGVRYGHPDNRALIVSLSEQLEEINEALGGTFAQRGPSDQAS